MNCDGMNDEQRDIAETTEGIVVVDAGPGTGKTFTIMNRYINIITKDDVDPQEVLLLTFTHNAADEMKERVVNELYRRGMKDVDVNSVRASTFDSFCSSVLMRDTSSIHRYLGIEERLSRQVRLIENAAMNRRYFQEFYDRFLDRHGSKHGDIALLLWDKADEISTIISRLLTLGTCPTVGGWFRNGLSILEGEVDAMLVKANEMNSEGKGGLFNKINSNKDYRPGTVDAWSGPVVDDNAINDAIRHDRTPLFRFIHHVFLEYLRRSISENRLTFQMVAFFAFLSLYNDRSVRDAESYRYVMIDEFQDTNELQFLISLLILKEPNLCVVGDWKQGIYGFRYADIENLLEFDTRIDELTDELGRRCKVPLESPRHKSLKTNYRSADRVIRLSEKTLFLNATKDEVLDPIYIRSKLVTLNSAKSSLEDGDCRVRFLKAAGQKDEVDLILHEAQKMVSEGITVTEWDGDGYVRRPLGYGDIAVLSRKRNLLHMLERRARELGMPLLMDGDMEIFLSREGKIVLAWLRMISDAEDQRGIAAIMDHEGHPHDAIAAVKEGLAPLPEEIRIQRELLLTKQRTPNQLMTAIFQRYGIDNDISQAIISQVSGLHEGSLTGTAEMIALIEENIRKADSYPADMISSRDSVHLHTMHGAKGLEYPAVIVAGLNSNDMPSKKGEAGTLRFDRLYGLRAAYELVDEDGMLERHRDWRTALVAALSQKEYDEERRLLYVAVSRSMQHLVFTCHDPSPFISGMSDHHVHEVEFTAPDSLLETEVRKLVPRPELETAEVVRRNMGVHSILRPILEGGGKGTEHGSKVHADAERLVHGMAPWQEHKGLDAVREVLSSAEGARVTTEVDCLLPMGDVSLEGRIDLLVEHDDKVEIHDWKTDMSETNLSEYVIQLSVYAHAAAVLGKDVECIVHFLELGTRRAFEPMPMKQLMQVVSDRLAESSSIGS